MSGPLRRSATVFSRLEPISIIGTCATEAMWDAGRGGEPEAICRYCEGARQRDAPRSPRPLRGCGQDGRLLRYPPRQYRHIAFVGRLAYGPSWPQRITRLVMKQVLSMRQDCVERGTRHVGRDEGLTEALHQDEAHATALHLLVVSH